MSTSTPGPFANPNRDGMSPAHYNPSSGPVGSLYWGGFDGTPYGPGHGHGSGFPGGERPPVADMLGNIANRGAGVETPNMPRW